jgi:hypothetical protein
VFLNTMFLLAFTPRRPHPWSGAVSRTGSCMHYRDRKTVLSQNATLVRDAASCRGTPW